MDSLQLLDALVRIPGPPGQEREVADFLERQVAKLGLSSEYDAKGNLLVPVGQGAPKAVVTAHMDEIAMIVRSIQADGSLSVGNMGGLHPWKLGETPVEIMADSGPIPGVLGFGSIHTEDKEAVSVQVRSGPLEWGMASVFTGKSSAELADVGVRVGARVVLARSRRGLWPVGDHVAGNFLDDRADLVAWLLALERQAEIGGPAMFAATTAEEVGGEGAMYLLHRLRPDVCIALEIGPSVPDAPVELTQAPSVWVADGYSAMSAADGALVARIAKEAGIPIQHQALSRGGSDASASAAIGLCARGITLSVPVQNSHGFEIMHSGAMEQLARLTVELLKRVLS